MDVRWDDNRLIASSTPTPLICGCTLVLWPRMPFQNLHRPLFYLSCAQVHNERICPYLLLFVLQGILRIIRGMFLTFNTCGLLGTAKGSHPETIVDKVNKAFSKDMNIGQCSIRCQAAKLQNNFLE